MEHNVSQPSMLLKDQEQYHSLQEQHQLKQIHHQKDLLDLLHLIAEIINNFDY